MKISLGLSFDDVLLVPQRSHISSRAQVSLKTEISRGFFLNIPIIAINMDSVTGVDMALAMSQKGSLAFMPRFDSPEVNAEKIAAVKAKGGRVIAALGLRDDYLERAKLCVRAGADGLTVDVAHGHMQKALEVTKQLKNKFRLPIFSGVVATEEGAYDLFAAGADAVRVGVGAGTICTTRIMTGCGVPQITALESAVKAKKKFKNKFVLADGGMKNSGDIVKALAVGASAVICGSLLAGTDECPGTVITYNNKLYKEYNASTSRTEKLRQSQKHNGHAAHFHLHIEGVEAMVPYKGSVNEVLDELCAGIRSGLAYCGAKDIPSLWKKAQFVQITNAGMRESQAHDVFVTESFIPSKKNHQAQAASLQ